MGLNDKQIARRLGLIAVLAGLCFGLVREPLAATASALATRQTAVISRSPDHGQLPVPQSDAPVPFEEENGFEPAWDADDEIDRHAELSPVGFKPLKASVLCHGGSCHLSTPRELLYSLQNLRI